MISSASRPRNAASPTVYDIAPWQLLCLLLEVREQMRA
jgi:hypothetical protein